TELNTLLRADPHPLDDVILMAAIGRIAEGLRQLASALGNPAPAASAPPPPPAQTEATLSELARLLAANDIGARDFCHQHAATLASAFGPHHPALTGLVDRFELEQALALLKRVRGAALR
ncbi:MAG: hypothetical protein DWQ11_15885, partial [Proteobacteria bacterium]